MSAGRRSAHPGTQRERLLASPEAGLFISIRVQILEASFAPRLRSRGPGEDPVLGFGDGSRSGGLPPQLYQVLLLAGPWEGRMLLDCGWIPKFSQRHLFPWMVIKLLLLMAVHLSYHLTDVTLRRRFLK